MHVGIPVLALAAAANIVSFFLMGVDKRRARKGKWRISEKMLFISAGCFGALGGVLGMHIFRHKTQHWYFKVFFPVMLVVQAALLAAGAYFVYIYK